MQETRESIELDSAALERGYRNSRSIVKNHFAGNLWIVSNLPGDERKSLDALMSHLVRVLDLLNLDSSSGLSLDVWHEVRDDLSDALCGKCRTEELAALADTAGRYEIPKQFLFDPISAADMWIRNRQFKTYEELTSFAARIGGSLMAAIVPILGYLKPNYEVAAMKCGQSVFLTQVMANFVNNAKLNNVFVAQEDIDACELDLHRLKLRQGGKPLTYLIRLYCSRIEKTFYEAGKLVSYLDFDAKRSVTSLLALHWRMLLKMQREPESVLDPDAVLSRRELWELKAKHLLGIEGNLPIITDDVHH